MLDKNFTCGLKVIALQTFSLMTLSRLIPIRVDIYCWVIKSSYCRFKCTALLLVFKCLLHLKACGPGWLFSPYVPWHKKCWHHWPKVTIMSCFFQNLIISYNVYNLNWRMLFQEESVQYSQYWQQHVLAKGYTAYLNDSDDVIENELTIH